MRSPWIAFAWILAGCTNASHTESCTPGDAGRPGFICDNSGHWQQAPTQNRCTPGSTSGSYQCADNGYWYDSTPTVCKPGDLLLCQSINGQPGTRTCNFDGQGYGDCTPTASTTNMQASCVLPGGTWLMTKTLLDGSLLCPEPASELFVVPSARDPFLGTDCELLSRTEISLANGSCGVTMEIQCSDGSSLVLDQDLFDGGFGRLYVSAGELTCLYQTELHRNR